jgi:hypothetical protein
MRNRAKCKLCGDILESFHEFDYQTCKCNEISISGGLIKYECAAKDFANFLRVDDEGNEIVPKISSKDENIANTYIPELHMDKKNIIDSLDSQIKTFKRIFELHPDMQYQYVSQSDFVSALELVLDCLRSG